MTFLIDPLNPPPGCESACEAGWAAGGRSLCGKLPNWKISQWLSLLKMKQAVTASCPASEKVRRAALHINSPCSPTGLLSGRWRPTTSSSVAAIFKHLCPRHCGPRHCITRRWGGFLFFVLLFFPLVRFWAPKVQSSPGICRVQLMRPGVSQGRKKWPLRTVTQKEERGSNEITQGCHETKPPHQLHGDSLASCSTDFWQLTNNWPSIWLPSPNANHSEEMRRDVTQSLLAFIQMNVSSVFSLLICWFAPLGVLGWITVSAVLFFCLHC